MLLLLGLVPEGAAQERTVTGTVTNAETLQPLSGVQVMARGTSVGTLTDQSGRFSLRVPAGATTLSFSSIGFRAADVPISGTTVDVALAPQALALEGVVVTALGMTQRERAIGTSVQSISAEEVSTAREVNIVNALSGKVSGVAITNSGPQGGSSRIVIRGASSITGNNQPLFVVDGTPIDNSGNRRELQGFGGVDYGNAVQDINPNDIESITVLKGPNAAALYGSRASNGAILITTKRGRNTRGLGVTASQNLTFETPLRLPDYQNEFGQGYNGQFSYVDGAGGGQYDGFDESWGPRMEGQMVNQFFGTGPFSPQPNNVRDFFETGRTSTTNVALSGSAENANARLSLTRMDLDGMYPGQALTRNTVSLAGGMRLTSRFSADASIQYVDSDAENRPGVGYGGDNPMQQFIWFGRQVDTKQLRNYKDANGKHYNWNYNYHNNPYWIALENRNYDSRDRVMGSGTLSYQLTDWLTGRVSSGTDWYRDWRKRTYAAGDIGLGFPDGGFRQENLYVQETNTDFLLTANRQLANIGLTASVGGNRRDNNYRENFEAVNRLVVPGVYNIGNSAVTPIVEQLTREKRVNSLYGQAQFAYNDYLFVDVTGRNDWSSTLPETSNSYFYPSISTSFVFSDAVPALSFGGALEYGKVRASWARVGNDTDPYQLRPTYAAQTRFGSTPRFAVPNRLPNSGLKPEETTSWEIGTELSFLDRRVILDATYYNAATRNQILPVMVSPTTGFTEAMLNAGEVTNKGVELLTTLTPIRTADFEWNSTVNFAKNNNMVTELYGDLQSVVLGTYWSATVQARVGERYGAIVGNPWTRDDQGRLLVNANGLPYRNLQQEVLGHYTPNWTGGWQNQFRFRNMDMSFLFDTQQGGQLYSVTSQFGLYAGVLEETLRGRCSKVTVNGQWVASGGMPACDANTGIIVDGYKADGTKNDIVVSSQQYNTNMYPTHEPHIYDASYVKLREMKFGYTLPASLNSRMGISSTNISLVGRNLMLWAKAPHIDPETAFDAGNAQGFEFGQLPSTRSFGINVTVTP
jgi:TonB-linked SusC/RagA family outer membrane protein